MAENSCGNCRYWWRLHPGEPAYGECRRNAPIALPGKDMGIWPVTLLDDGCGCHDARPAPSEPPPGGARSLRVVT